jgi:hypothetical protein
VERFGEPFVVAAGLRYPKRNAAIDNETGT